MDLKLTDRAALAALPTIDAKQELGTDYFYLQ